MKVAQSYPTLCDPMDYTVHGILQARILEWVAFSFRGSSKPRDRTQVSQLQADSLPASHKGSPRILKWVAYPFSSRSSQPRNRTRVSCIAGGFFINWAIREAQSPEGNVKKCFHLGAFPLPTPCHSLSHLIINYCFDSSSRDSASLVAQHKRTHLLMEELWDWSLGWAYSLEKEMATHSSILA